MDCSWPWLFLGLTGEHLKTDAWTLSPNGASSIFRIQPNGWYRCTIQIRVENWRFRSARSLHKVQKGMCMARTGWGFVFQDVPQCVSVHSPVMWREGMGDWQGRTGWRYLLVFTTVHTVMRRLWDRGQKLHYIHCWFALGKKTLLANVKRHRQTKPECLVIYSETYTC